MRRRLPTSPVSQLLMPALAPGLMLAMMLVMMLVMMPQAATGIEAPATAASADKGATAGTGPRSIPAGARLAATCTGCHGTNGTTVGGALPSLAGQSKETLLASLRAFRAGERPATVMTQLAKGYSEAQLEQIAAFFATREQPAAQPAGAGS
jgi:sulfide dehydrogenase cytochrome subunit